MRNGKPGQKAGEPTSLHIPQVNDRRDHRKQKRCPQVIRNAAPCTLPDFVCDDAGQKARDVTNDVRQMTEVDADPPEYCRQDPQNPQGPSGTAAESPKEK